MWFLSGFSRDQIHDAAHCAGSVERRSDTFDHLDLPEVHRRNLQQAEGADLFAEERQAIRQESASIESEVVKGENPSFTTTISALPGGIVTVTTPSAFVI